MNMNLDPDDPRRHVFRYDEHMPDTDDLPLIALKGHLLVEEMLVELSSKLLPHHEYLDDASLRFHQKVSLVRSALHLKHNHRAWDLINALNRLRNDLVHSLEPPKLANRLDELFRVYAEIQVDDDMPINKSHEADLDRPERLKNVVIDCMQFLRNLLYSDAN
jgi:hypothetical protein